MWRYSLTPCIKTKDDRDGVKSTHQTRSQNLEKITKQPTLANSDPGLKTWVWIEVHQHKAHLGLQGIALRVALGLVKEAFRSELLLDVFFLAGVPGEVKFA